MAKLQMLKPRVQQPGARVQTVNTLHPNATPRQRGRKWMERRARLLRASPLCCMCAERGITRAATEVDHIIPLFKGGPDVDENTQNLCHDCHAEKTRQDMQE